MTKMPNVLEKRNWIYGQSIPENELIRIGQAYEQESHFNDAVECLKKTNKPELLDNIKKHAIDQGDYFLAKKIDDVFAISKEEWTTLAKNAEQKQKTFFARSAYEILENNEKVDELVQKLKQDYQGKYFERL